MTTPPRFTEPVEAAHLRLSLADWDDVFVVGDVHGCRTELERLLAKLGVSDDDLVVFVGDLVRKGPDSHGVVSLVREHANMFSVRGNNEEKLLRGEKTVPDLTAADRAYIESLPVVISWDGALVVHGGVDPRKPLDEHTVDDLQTTRSLVPGGSYDRPYWYERYAGPDRVFFGHTVHDSPVVTDWAVGLDTGCVYGGSLTAYDWHADELVTVEAERTVQRRADEKIVEPRRAAAEH
jgi:serine/threonine protein phosphatase 1